MPSPEQLAKDTLDKLAIPYQEFTHPPVFTCEEADRLCPPMPGIKNKNLFLRDKKARQYYLVTMPAAKNLDLKELSGKIGVKGLSFASAERLKEVLNIDPGSVGLLALINDVRRLTLFYIDQDLLDDEWLSSHPLVNTTTITFPTASLGKFLNHTGHALRIVEL